MPVNPYFGQIDPVAAELLSDLYQEAIQISGIDVIYLPRTLVKADRIFGEDVLSMFKQGYEIEVYMEETESFSGRDKFFDKFGLQFNDQINFIMSRKTFLERVPNGKFPSEGDMIFIPFSQKCFEIKYVDDDNPLNPHGFMPIWKISAEMVKFSDETVQTGDRRVDIPFMQAVSSVTYTLKPGGSGNYQINETVTQGAVSGRVLSWDRTKLSISITDISGGDFQMNQNLLGLTSMASWIIDSGDSINPSSQYADNLTLKQEADAGIENWDESNPFGGY